MNGPHFTIIIYLFLSSATENPRPKKGGKTVHWSNSEIPSKSHRPKGKNNNICTHWSNTEIQ
jgi:hypothetical protein